MNIDNELPQALEDHSDDDLGPHLIALRELLRSGVRLSSVRLGVVVCQHSKELATVLRLNGDRMVLYEGVVERVRVAGDMSAVETVELHRRVNRELVYLDDAEPGAHFIAANRCCTASVAAVALAGAIDAGTSRVACVDVSP